MHCARSDFLLFGQPQAQFELQVDEPEPALNFQSSDEWGREVLVEAASNISTARFKSLRKRPIYLL